MEELRTNDVPGSRIGGWRRLNPATTISAVVVLAVSGWAHFAGWQSRESSPPTRANSASLVHVGQTFPVSTIQHEIDEPPGTGVITASATSFSGDSEQPDDDGIHASSPGDSDTPDPDARMRTAIIGEWKDEYYGKRHLTVHEDGTGTMVVEPNGIGKRLFAAELKFELEWSLSDGHVTLKMIRGEPKSKVQLILKLYGQEAEYRILDMTGDQMLLLDPDGKTRYDWRRPPAGGDGGK